MSGQIDYLAQALRDAGMLELRHQSGDRWVSGTFDDPDALRREIGQRVGVGNLYTSLNAPHRELRAGNVMGTKPLGNDDFAHHVRLPFDFDPVRPKGMPSTDSELAAAIKARDRFVAAMLGLGWPAPALAVSGNGAHAIWRCRLLVNDETRDMLAELYQGARADFGTDTVDFDPVVRNPGRIWRLYGSVNRKGIATPERPHRVASIVMPSRWMAVSPQQIERMAAGYARRNVRSAAAPRADAPRIEGKGDYSTLDVVSWFRAHGLYRRPLGQGRHAVRCPWEHEHSTPSNPFDSSTAIFEADGTGWPAFKCLHQHCDGRGIREVMQVLGDADNHCAREWRRSA